MNAAVLRAAAAGDWDALCALLRAAGLPSADLSADRLADFIVAPADAGLAGSCGLEIFGEQALLRSLAVVAARRGCGLGAALLAEVEALARARGVQWLYLLTTTAAGFFLRSDYRVLNRGVVPAAIRATAEFASLCPASAVCMSKRL